MRRHALLSVLFAGAIFFSACSTQSSLIPWEQVPAGNSDEIQVEKAFDYVYLAVFDVVNELDGWAPDKTLKEEGLIRLQNTRFSRLDDSDARVIKIRIRRDSQIQTSVFLDPDSRRIIGAGDVLTAIRTKLESV